MSDITSLERTLLARARGALEPTAADRGRIREQLAARMASASVVAASSASAPLPSHPLRHLIDAHRVALSSTVLTVGLVAFGAGYFLGQRNQKPIVTTVTQYGPSTIPRRHLPAPNTQAQQTPPAVPVDLPSSPPSLTSFPDRGRGGTGAKAAPSTATSAKSNDGSLSEELDLLRRAERTIRAGNSMVALGLLNELDARFPKGQMLDERAAARVMGNCQLTDPSSAKAMGQAYLGSHAQSVYTARVRSICHLDSENSPTGSRGAGN